MDSKDILEVLEGACFRDDIETNPQLNVFFQKILVRFYLHLWSIEVGKEDGSVSFNNLLVLNNFFEKIMLVILLVQVGKN